VKEKIKKIFPLSILLVLLLEYIKDYYAFIKYTGVFEFISSGQKKILGNIIADYHVIEKGLTMPQTRLGFGKTKTIKLIDHCMYYTKRFDVTDNQFLQAIAVINEYKDFHEINNYDLDKELLDKIRLLQSNLKGDMVSRKQINNAIEIAITSPSSCNRQASRVYVFEDRDLVNEILKIQGGNRGFGHLATKLIIVTFEMGFSHGVYERNMAYVDGGIFAMNLLNGLHFNRVAACPLNCYFSSSKAKKIKKITGIKKSEKLVVMISCGNVPEKFDIAKSYRYPVEEFITYR
jgi:nitroreductase